MDLCYCRYTFYPRDATRWAGLCQSDVSVCLSVRYIRYCIKTKRASVMISSPSDSAMIWASGKVWLVEKFARGQPERGRFVRVGWVRTGDFSTYKPPYLRNGARYDQEHLTLTGNRISAVDWYQNQRPWMTLNWPWAAITRFFTLLICISEPTTKIWMKINPYCQQQKCSLGIAVSTEVKFVRIFPWVRWGEGVKWEWGMFFQRFSTNMSQYLENVRDRAIVIHWTLIIGSCIRSIDPVISNDLEWPLTWVSRSR